MATVAEMQLLNNAIGDLSHTLMANRTLKQQGQQAADRNALDREMVDLHRQDSADQRANRASAIKLQGEHQKALEQIQSETKALQDRHYKIMQQTGLLSFLQKGVADGSIDVDKLKTGVADNPLLQDLGIGVDLFKKPMPDEGAFITDPETGERFLQRGKVTLKSGNPRPQVTDEPDPLGGPPKRKVTRRILPGELDAAMGTLPAGPDPAAGPSAEDQATMEEILARPGQPAGGPPPAIGMPSAPAMPSNITAIQPGAGAVQPGVTHFATKEQALAAGKQSGDKIMLWDPAQKRYRPFQLE